MALASPVARWLGGAGSKKCGVAVLSVCPLTPFRSEGCGVMNLHDSFILYTFSEPLLMLGTVVKAQQAHPCPPRADLPVI
jgi:hypothetical protein